MFNGDKAGREEVNIAVLELNKKMFVRVVDVGNGRQPEQLSKDELTLILA